MTDMEVLLDYCMRADLVDTRLVMNAIRNQHPINKLTHEAFETAKDKGWWDSSRSLIECLALVHCEVSEAIEDCRVGDFEHVPEELADVLIRVFDLCGSRDWDLEKAVLDKMAFNKTRPYRHGNKLA